MVFVRNLYHDGIAVRLCLIDHREVTVHVMTLQVRGCYVNKHNKLIYSFRNFNKAVLNHISRKRIKLKYRHERTLHKLTNLYPKTFNITNVGYNDLAQTFSHNHLFLITPKNCYAFIILNISFFKMNLVL